MQLTLSETVRPAASASYQDAILNKAFITAVLLTGNSRQAEAAVMEAIGLSKPCEALEHGLIRGAIRASIDMDDQALLPGAGEDNSAISMVPMALRGVLNLSLPLRRCFVLRMLTGLPRQVCARMLNLNPMQVDRYACAAAVTLAGGPSVMGLETASRC